MSNRREAPQDSIQLAALRDPEALAAQLSIEASRLESAFAFAKPDAPIRDTIADLRTLAAALSEE